MMPDNIKVLGQSKPSGATLTDLYTVPSGSGAKAVGTVCSTVAVCNQSAAVSAKFRIAIAVAGAGDDVKQYIYYDEKVFAGKTFMATVGVTMGQTDVLRVQSDTGTVSFTAFGAEKL